MAMSSATDSAMFDSVFHGMHYAATANFELLETAVRKARELGITPHVGPVFCSDTFYQPTDEASRVMGQHGVLGVEMESAALYMLAARYGGRALAIMTVSDMVDGSAEQTTAKERETGFQDMMKIALETAACFAD